MKTTILTLALLLASPLMGQDKETTIEDILNSSPKQDSVRQQLLNRLSSKGKEIRRSNQQFFENLVEERPNLGKYGVDLLASGTNIGGGNTSNEFTSTWCRGQMAILDKYQKRARTKLNSRGDYFGSNKILVDGIKAALKKSGNINSFTRSALERGLRLAGFIKAEDRSNSERKNRSVSNILNSYYQFVINDVARDLDLYTYIPYIRRTPGEVFDTSQFEKNFVRYAEAQLKWINDNLAETSRHYGEIVITPIGNTDEYLLAAQLLTLNTSFDLDNSLWRYRFACAIDALQVLNENIEHFNLGNRDIYEDERFAIASVFVEIEDIINQINKKDSCL